MEEVGETDLLKRRYRQSCDIGASVNSSVRLVRVRWRQVNRARWWTVAAPQGIALQAGDAVYVNVASCIDAAQPRIVR